MAASWLLAPLLLAQALASADVTCLSSIKVIDDFLSDAEAQAVLTDLEAQRTGPVRVRQEAPVLAHRLKSERRSAPAPWKCWSLWANLFRKSRATQLWRDAFGKQ